MEAARMEAMRRRRWRITIRDTLWLTLAVALSVGWWVRERQFEHERSQLAGELRRHTEWTESYRQMGRETGGWVTTTEEGRVWRLTANGVAGRDDDLAERMRFWLEHARE